MHQAEYGMFRFAPVGPEAAANNQQARATELA
jgi:hypothetical protein